MPSLPLRTLAPFLALSAFVSAQEREGRSFVGKKLPAVTFIDTEGHRIQTAHYQGSVLVMVTGIAW
jgi:hypothetical protein